jgi:hypothetical protein
MDLIRTIGHLADPDALGFKGRDQNKNKEDKA